MKMLLNLSSLDKKSLLYERNEKKKRNQDREWEKKITNALQGAHNQILISFLVAGINYSNKSHSGKKGSILAPSLHIQSWGKGKSRGQQLEAAGCVASTSRKQRTSACLFPSIYTFQDATKEMVPSTVNGSSRLNVTRKIPHLNTQTSFSQVILNSVKFSINIITLEYTKKPHRSPMKHRHASEGLRKHITKG